MVKRENIANQSETTAGRSFQPGKKTKLVYIANELPMRR